MLRRINSDTVCAKGLFSAVALLGLSAIGCNSSTPNANQALDNALKATGATKDTVAKFAGTVLIDGKPPGAMGYVRTLVILCDPKKEADPKASPAYVACTPEGHFEFTTYEKGDGVPSGSYVVCFAQLEGGFRLGRAAGWRGPDRLKNLFNDPDKNKDEKEFVVEVSPPGKTDWKFDLETTGKQPVANPGPHAFTQVH